METDGRNNLVFVMEASFDQSYTLCFKEIQVPSKLRVLPSGTFFLNSGLRKKRAINLARESRSLQA